MRTAYEITELVARLDKGEFRRSSRLWSVGARLALWVSLEIAIALAVAIFAPRGDLYLRFGTLLYASEIVLFTAAGIVAAELALRSAIPGRQISAGEIAAFVAMTATAIVLVATGPSSKMPLSEFLAAGERCLLCTFALAAAPWALLFLLVRRGAALREGMTGSMTGAAAFFFTIAVTRLGCPIDGAIHVLTWHVGSAFVAIALSAIVGHAYLGLQPHAVSTR